MLNVPPARASALAGAPSSRRVGGATSYVVLEAVPAGTVARRGEARPRRAPARTAGRRERGGWAAPAALALAFLVAPVAVAARAPVVRAWPEAAILFSAAGLPVNLVGATLSDVAATLAPDGDGGLVVTGRIAGAASRPVVVPPLEASLRNEAGEVMYRWTIAPPRPELAPGEDATFSTRLATPPPDARRVRVTFAHRGRPDEGGAAVASRRF